MCAGIILVGYISSQQNSASLKSVIITNRFKEYSKVLNEDLEVTAQKTVLVRHI